VLQLSFRVIIFELSLLRLLSCLSFFYRSDDDGGDDDDDYGIFCWCEKEGCRKQKLYVAVIDVSVRLRLVGTNKCSTRQKRVNSNE
jgi:hypothetical protein